MAQMQWLGTLDKGNDWSALGNAIREGTSAYVGAKEQKRKSALEEREQQYKENLIKTTQEELAQKEDKAVLDIMSNELHRAKDAREAAEIVKKWGPILDSTNMGARFKEKNKISISEALKVKAEPGFWARRAAAGGISTQGGQIQANTIQPRTGPSLSKEEFESARSSFFPSTQQPSPVANAMTNPASATPTSLAIQSPVSTRTDEWVTVTNPKGKRVQIKSSQLTDALKQGYSR